jgi:hypothetical protein
MDLFNNNYNIENNDEIYLHIIRLKESSVFDMTVSQVNQRFLIDSIVSPKMKIPAEIKEQLKK